ncbi:procathepsin L-like [Macrobrachium nipponense]|uniref:procathepsin L-like n=1 Tax=Macrobrachium nipponense TaxID=159736 RepID=UPI0030C84063
MKSIALVLLGVALATCSPATNERWIEFKKAYGKTYASLEEERYRESVHDQNQKFIDDHNAKYDQGLETFSLKMNQFGDMTQDEIVSTMNGLQTREGSSTKTFSYDSDEPLTETVDWRLKGAVTAVKDQKQCGSCWAFSTTGSLEGQQFLKTGMLVSLSEQNLVDCSSDFGNLGCFGGLMDNAFKYIKANKGIDTEESYPYEAKDGKCRFDPAKVGATDTGFVDLPKGNESALQNAVAKIGPISVGIDASRSSFHFYHSGVYSDNDCSSTQLDHGVLAIGYGTDEKGGDFWIVKNSWNQTWGEEGYIRMSRNNKNNCGIATQASYPLV